MFDKKLWSKEYQKKRRLDPDYKEKKAIWDKRYNIKNKAKIQSKALEWYHKKKAQDPEWVKRENIRKREYQKEYRVNRGKTLQLERKMKIINHYGGCCACCGIQDHEFLAVDHIDGHGNEHRRSMGIKGGRHFYDWLIRNDFPKGFQILCHNCNFAKDHYENGCPHNNRGD